VSHHPDRVLNMLQASRLVHHPMRHVCRGDEIISGRHVTIQSVHDKLGLHVQALTFPLVQMLNNVTHANIAAKLPSFLIPAHQAHVTRYIHASSKATAVTVTHGTVTLSMIPVHTCTGNIVNISGIVTSTILLKLLHQACHGQHNS